MYNCETDIRAADEPTQILFDTRPVTSRFYRLFRAEPFFVTTWVKPQAESFNPFGIKSRRTPVRKIEATPQPKFEDEDENEAPW
jgi:hypothetical protein